jgi:hypothetical protein
MTIPDGTMANASMVNHITHKSPACFSYVVQPTTPCVLGTAKYEESENNDDEFFLTASGVVHSCPNIYETSVENEDRKLQSCDHFTPDNGHLNAYHTELDHYTIRLRFPPTAISASSESLNSEIELYQERHALGFSRKQDSPRLSTTWKSDNSLLAMSVRFRRTSSYWKIRSRSYEMH